MPRKGGARKAHKAMVKKYGAKKGNKIFYAKANKNAAKAKAKGKSPHARTQSYYKKGGKQK